MGVSPALVCLTDVKDEYVGFGDAWGHGALRWKSCRKLSDGGQDSSRRIEQSGRIQIRREGEGTRGNENPLPWFDLKSLLPLQDRFLFDG